MYDDLHALNDNRSDHSDNDDIVNNPDDLEHSDVEETRNAHYVSDDEANGGEAETGSTENKNEEGTKVEPKRKRVLNPQPKLNEERLKGPRGIGIIEKMFEDVKLKGKGHEKEDLELVMGRLEHWAHRLYPKFQFDDCLQRIEKLGSRRPVANYVKRIRMGMEEEVNEIIEPPSPPPSADPFDELIGQQQQPPATKKPVTLTAEQRERMLRNRMLAEERRMARLQAQKERSAEGNKNIEETRNSGSAQNISESGQMDVSENNREVDSEETTGNLDNATTVDLEVSITDAGDNEAIGSINEEVIVSHTARKLLNDKESSGEIANVGNDGNVKGVVSDTSIIFDNDSQGMKVVEMNSVTVLTEQDTGETKQ